MNANQFLARSAELVGAYGNFNAAPAQVDAETMALPRCQLIGQSLELFIRFCYATDANGIFHNLSGNMFIPRGVYVPFAHAGKPRQAKGSRSQLTRDEREVVRKWLGWLKQNRRFPLFNYVASSRRWAVDTVRYDSEGEALEWLKRNQLDVKTFVALRNG